MRGGPREGAGRKRGARNKASAAREAAVAASGLTPLEFLLSLMRDETQPPAVRLDAAKSAAPFVHPRYAAIEHRGEAHDQPQQQLKVRVVLIGSDGKERDFQPPPRLVEAPRPALPSQ